MSDEAMIEVPWQQLSIDAVQGLLEEFASRDGTDYGADELSMAAKVERIKTQLQAGKLIVVFDPMLPCFQKLLVLGPTSWGDININIGADMFVFCVPTNVSGNVLAYSAIRPLRCSTRDDGAVLVRRVPTPRSHASVPVAIERRCEHRRINWLSIATATEQFPTRTHIHGGMI